MTQKIYTVASNARRDAKKKGLGANAVKKVDGGWIIVTAPVRAKDGDKKREILRSMLTAGWQTIPALCEALEWLPHTVRGQISTIARASNVTAERRRIDGVSSYRYVARKATTNAELAA